MNNWFRCGRFLWQLVRQNKAVTWIFNACNFSTNTKRNLSAAASFHTLSMSDTAFNTIVVCKHTYWYWNSQRPCRWQTIFIDIQSTALEAVVTQYIDYHAYIPTGFIGFKNITIHISWTLSKFMQYLMLSCLCDFKIFVFCEKYNHPNHYTIMAGFCELCVGQMVSQKPCHFYHGHRANQFSSKFKGPIPSWG